MAKPTKDEKIEMLLTALELHAAYEELPADRGGKNGTKGRAWTAFIKARDAALQEAGR